MKNRDAQKIIIGVLCTIIIVETVLFCVQYYKTNNKDDSCSQIINATQNSSSFYQVFWGDWKITDFIKGTKIGQYNQDIVGSEVRFDRQAIYVGNEKIIDNPQYSFSLIPTSQWYSYCEPFVPDNPTEVFNLDSSYFAHVEITNTEVPNNALWVTEFYIKDDNTIIFNALVSGKTGLYRATRLDRVDDWTSYIAGA
jgi:hypothetical protein